MKSNTKILIHFAFILSVFFAGLFAIGAQFGVTAAIVTVIALESLVRVASFRTQLGANVLTSLAADIYRAVDIVGRELVGLIPGVTLNTDAGKKVALGDVVRSHFTRTPSVGTITPAMTIPEGTDQTVDSKTLTVTDSASVKIPWTGEDIKHVNNGSGYTTVYGDQIAQAMRAIVNQIEAQLGVVIKKGASRAFGTAGTTPFASDLSAVNEVRQILVDNGCPMDGQVSMVINSVAGTKMRNLTQLTKVNEAGTNITLRNGQLLDVSGLVIRESAGIVAHTKGTGSGYLVNGALAASTLAAPVTALVIDTGTGTILAGDIITFAADTTNKYVVGADGTTTLATLNDPGLRVAIADNNAITIGNNYTPNVAYHKSAVELVVRAMAVPPGGDAATDVMTIQDPFSGLVFDISVYKGYKKTVIEISCVYGMKVWKSQHIASLLG